MTDGRASHTSLIDVAELIALRKGEAGRAAKVLGLSDQDYQFLGLPDHDLVNHRAEAVPAIAKIMEDFRPELICVPHRRDQLEDHVITNEIVREALRGYHRRATILEYPVWLWHTWPWTTGSRRGQGAFWWSKNLVDALHLTFLCRTRIAIRDVLERKLNALREYRSQIERRSGDPNWPILADVSAGEFLSCFHTDFEIFHQWHHKP
jgi:LmbE family N-acetylglucosaminyl deacetylase